jgi:hypothetical protein
VPCVARAPVFGARCTKRAVHGAARHAASSRRPSTTGVARTACTAIGSARLAPASAITTATVRCTTANGRDR